MQIAGLESLDVSFWGGAKAFLVGFEGTPTESRPHHILTGHWTIN